MRAIVVLTFLMGVILTHAAHAQAFKAPCHVDTLCAGIESGGGRIMKCLRAHKTELSEQCLAAIGRSVMNWRTKDQGTAGAVQGEPPVDPAPH